MKRFKELVEAKTTIVFAFGRFNPPTTGHEKLIQKTASVAGSNPWRIYPSFTQNPKKDPLPHSLKIAYMRKMFKKYKRNIIADTDAKTAINIAVKLYDEGFKNLQMIAGSDRVKEFDSLLSTYNGVEGKRHGFYKFDTIEIISAGERDPDSEGVEGMSASKMRTAAVDGDFDLFSQGLPSGFADGKKLYRDVRKYMGIREEKDMGDMSDFEYIRDQYLTGKLWNVGDVVEANGDVGEVVRKGTNYLSFVSEDGKVHKAWLYDIELEEGFLDKVKKVKDFVKNKILKIKKALSTEKSETKKMLTIYKNRKNASKAELKYANDQFKDILKGLGLVTFTAIPVPGGGLLLAALTTVVKKKFDINILPSAFYEEIELDERNYRKEYDNYQGRPEQIARRSSRNKARRIMGDKTKIGMDIGHKDNNPLNNDPKNLRNEKPSKNRKEPRLRSEEEIIELAWYTKFTNWIDTHAHKKGFDKLAKEYADLIKSDKKYRDMPTRAILDIAKETKGVTARELRDYINGLVKKGVLPQELKADFDPLEEKIFSFKDFVDQINNK